MMQSTIVVHPEFDRTWPYAADHFHELWKSQGDVTFIRTEAVEARPVADLLEDPGSVTRLVCLGVPVTAACLKRLTSLREICATGPYNSTFKREDLDALRPREVRVIKHTSEGYWGESVSEFGLALTLCGLRRIPQTHHEILSSHDPWNYDPPGGTGLPGRRGHQFGDDPAFANGTLHGKRVRVVGAGNIASRYAAACRFLGADVAAWDPFASEPCFHRAGARREHHLDRLVRDAEIFAPMLPLTEKTEGLVTGALIDALPRGCLFVMVTRARVCDVDTLRKRVLADELALAADVFDIEPLPLDDALLGRHNVVHTPHNAGRTVHANRRFAEMLAEQFLPAS